MGINIEATMICHPQLTFATAMYALRRAIQFKLAGMYMCVACTAAVSACLKDAVGCYKTDFPHSHDWDDRKAAEGSVDR
jgi:hypothetical protein